MTSDKHPAVVLLQSLLSWKNYLTYDHVVDLLSHAPTYYVAWWKKLYHDTPEHVYIETALILFIIWLLFIRKTVDPKKSSKQSKLTKEEKQMLIDTWQPEPLVPPMTKKQEKLLHLTPMIDAINGKQLTVRNVSKPVLRMSSFDFLGFSLDPTVKQTARSALEKYGCGSCGPRGFYGTIDTHLNFEKEIAEYLNVEEAILYSDSASTISSAIASFSKKGDLLIIDEACNESVLAGANLSRSTVHYFKHNDMEDLASILQSVSEDDVKYNVDSKLQRRFIVVEGIYRNTGELCNLPELLRLKKKYFYRLIVDETLSFGTLGSNGKGLTEYYNCNIRDIEVVMFGLDTTLASIGGVCVGARDIIDHQRLSSGSYCFSASAPPFLSSVASHTLQLMKSNTHLLSKLTEVTKSLTLALKELESVGLSIMNGSEQHMSPVIHLVLTNMPSEKELEDEIMIDLAKSVIEQGVGASLNRMPYMIKKSPLSPSIRVNASVLLTSNDIANVVSGFTVAMKQIRKKYGSQHKF